MRTLALTCLVAVMPFVVGCAQSSDSAAISETGSADVAAGTAAAETAAAETAAAASNKNCPIMGHEIAADGGSTTWNGKTIGFCCEGCLPKWEALSDAEKAAKLAAADGGEHAGHVDHGDAAEQETESSAGTQS